MTGAKTRSVDIFSYHAGALGHSVLAVTGSCGRTVEHG